MDEIPERPNMILELFRKGEGFTNQASAELAKGVVKTLDMVGQPSVLADRTMAFWRENFGIRLPEIGVKDGTLSIVGW